MGAQAAQDSHAIALATAASFLKMKLALTSVFIVNALAVDFPYMSGLNVPWHNFGYDIGGGTFNASWFETYFSAAQSGNQNIARFWVHTDGARAGLEYASDGTITGLSATFNDDLKQLLGIAQKH